MFVLSHEKKKGKGDLETEKKEYDFTWETPRGWSYTTTKRAILQPVRRKLPIDEPTTGTSTIPEGSTKPRGLLHDVKTQWEKFLTESEKDVIAAAKTIINPGIQLPAPKTKSEVRTLPKAVTSLLRGEQETSFIEKDERETALIQQQKQATTQARKRKLFDKHGNEEEETVLWERPKQKKTIVGTNAADDYKLKQAAGLKPLTVAEDKTPLLQAEDDAIIFDKAKEIRRRRLQGQVNSGYRKGSDTPEPELQLKQSELEQQNAVQRLRARLSGQESRDDHRALLLEETKRLDTLKKSLQDTMTARGQKIKDLAKRIPGYVLGKHKEAIARVSGTISKFMKKFNYPIIEPGDYTKNREQFYKKVNKIQYGHRGQRRGGRRGGIGGIVMSGGLQAFAVLIGEVLSRMIFTDLWAEIDESLSNALMTEAEKWEKAELEALVQRQKQTLQQLETEFDNSAQEIQRYERQIKEQEAATQKITELDQKPLSKHEWEVIKQDQGTLPRGADDKLWTTPYENKPMNARTHPIGQTTSKK